MNDRQFFENFREVFLESTQIPEATVIGNDDSKYEPLQDNDTIRVYHGNSNPEALIVAITKGLSGDKKVFRTHSYENDNNPNGMFVTPDIKTAKKFGHYIIEFHVKLKDLEAPVWPSGSYTVQGQPSSQWDNDGDRKAAQEREREEQSKSKHDYISQSSKPEVIAKLFHGGERQALFMGDLDRNSIRSIWISDKPGYTTGKFSRYTPKEVLALYNGDGIPNIHVPYKKPEEDPKLQRDANRKLVKPREEITLDKIIQRITQKYKHIDKEEAIQLLKDEPDFFRDYVWSNTQWKQLQDIIKELP